MYKTKARINTHIISYINVRLRNDHNLIQILIQTHNQI